MLRVSPKASEGEVKAAYLKLAREHHPDVSSAPDASLQFKVITEAYAVRTLRMACTGCTRICSLERSLSWQSIALAFGAGREEDVPAAA